MIRNISPDKEKSKSLFKMAIKSQKLRARMFQALLGDEDQTYLAQSYYETIRQLVMSIMLFEGLKPIGENAHKETLDYLEKQKQFTAQEIFILQDLRIRRNRGMYEGKFIKKPYLENNKEKLEKIIDKLKKIMEKKLR